MCVVVCVCEQSWHPGGRALISRGLCCRKATLCKWPGITTVTHLLIWRLCRHSVMGWGGPVAPGRLRWRSLVSSGDLGSGLPQGQQQQQPLILSILKVGVGGRGGRRTQDQSRNKMRMRVVQRPIVLRQEWALFVSVFLLPCGLLWCSLHLELNLPLCS